MQKSWFFKKKTKKIDIYIIIIRNNKITKKKGNLTLDSVR